MDRIICKPGRRNYSRIRGRKNESDLQQFIDGKLREEIVVI
jgi:hypothetical protein